MTVDALYPERLNETFAVPEDDVVKLTSTGYPPKDTHSFFYV